MDLIDFRNHVKAEREAQRLTNLQKISTIITNTEKDKND